MVTNNYLDFEKPIAELEKKIDELVAAASAGTGANVRAEITKLREKSNKALADLYSNLDPWKKTKVARHPDRPHFKDYVEALIKDYTPLSGDRAFGDDEAIQGGLGRFKKHNCVIIGHEKGSTTEERLKHNFGMARPEGYRKAIRLMDLAQKYNLPVISLVDTAGAYPGLDAEARGQAEAIARCTERCLTLGVPMISIITGEGGSGGAVAIASANSVLMLENSIYSVISPEGAASILYRSQDKARDAAIGMKITAADLKTLGVIDDIIPEPIGGAHRHIATIIDSVGKAIEKELRKYEKMDAAAIKAHRRERFLAIGRTLGT